MAIYFDYGNVSYGDSTKVKEKKEKVSKATADKRATLSPSIEYQPFNLDSMVDADTYSNGDVKARLGNGNDYVDAAETSGYRFESNPNGRIKQAIAISRDRGIPYQEVTDDMIYEHGEATKQKAIDFINKGQVNHSDQGAMQVDPSVPRQDIMAGFSDGTQEIRQEAMPQIGLDDKGQSAGYTRGLYDMVNPVTGASLSNALNNPTDNVKYYDPKNQAKRTEDAIAYANTPENIRNVTADRDRSLGEIAQDLATGAAKIPVRLGEAAYGGLDMVADTLMKPVDFAAKQLDKVLPDWLNTGYSIGDTGQNELTPRFSETIDTINSWQSAPTQASRERINAANADREAESEANIKGMVDAGIFEEAAIAADWVQKAGRAGVNVIDNPLAAADMFIESAGMMFTGGAIGKAVASSMAKGMTAAEIASTAGAAKLSAAAGTAGWATEALQEGLISGVETKEKILGTDYAKLEEESELYRAHRVNGLTPEQARIEVANSARDVDTMLTMGTSAVASKVAGAGKIEGNMLRGDASPTGMLNKGKAFGENIARETVQEMGQEGGGQTATNIAEMLTSNDDTTIGQGTAVASGTGGVMGGLTAAGMQSLTAPARALDKGKEAVATISAKRQAQQVAKEQRQAEARAERDKSDARASAESTANTNNTTAEDITTTTEDTVVEPEDMDDDLTEDAIYTSAKSKVKGFDETQPSNSAKLVEANKDLTPQEKTASYNKLTEISNNNITEAIKSGDVAAQMSALQSAEELSGIVAKDVLDNSQGSIPISPVQEAALLEYATKEGNINDTNKDKFQAILDKSPKFKAKFDNLTNSLKDLTTDLEGVGKITGADKTADEVMNEITTVAGDKRSLQDYINQATRAYSNGDTKALKGIKADLDVWKKFQQDRVNAGNVAKQAFESGSDTDRVAGIPIGNTGNTYGGRYGAKAGDTLLGKYDTANKAINSVGNLINKLSSVNTKTEQQKPTKDAKANTVQPEPTKKEDVLKAQYANANELQEMFDSLVGTDEAKVDEVKPEPTKKEDVPKSKYANANELQEMFDGLVGTAEAKTTGVKPNSNADIANDLAPNKSVNKKKEGNIKVNLIRELANASSALDVINDPNATSKAKDSAKSAYKSIVSKMRRSDDYSKVYPNEGDLLNAVKQKSKDTATKKVQKPINEVTTKDGTTEPASTKNIDSIDPKNNLNTVEAPTEITKPAPKETEDTKEEIQVDEEENLTIDELVELAKDQLSSIRNPDSNPDKVADLKVRYKLVINRIKAHPDGKSRFPNKGDILKTISPKKEKKTAPVTKDVGTTKETTQATNELTVKEKIKDISKNLPRDGVDAFNKYIDNYPGDINSIVNKAYAVKVGDILKSNVAVFKVIGTGKFLESGEPSVFMANIKRDMELILHKGLDGLTPTEEEFDTQSVDSMYANRLTKPKKEGTPAVTEPGNVNKLLAISKKAVGDELYAFSKYIDIVGTDLNSIIDKAYYVKAGDIVTSGKNTLEVVEKGKFLKTGEPAIIVKNPKTGKTYKTPRGLSKLTISKDVVDTQDTPTAVNNKLDEEYDVEELIFEAKELHRAVVNEKDTTKKKEASKKRADFMNNLRDNKNVMDEYGSLANLREAVVGAKTPVNNTPTTTTNNPTETVEDYISKYGKYDDDLKLDAGALHNFKGKDAELFMSAVKAQTHKITGGDKPQKVWDALNDYVNEAVDKLTTAKGFKDRFKSRKELATIIDNSFNIISEYKGNFVPREVDEDWMQARGITSGNGQEIRIREDEIGGGHTDLTKTSRDAKAKGKKNIDNTKAVVQDLNDTDGIDAFKTNNIDTSSIDIMDNVADQGMEDYSEMDEMADPYSDMEYEDESVYYQEGVDMTPEDTGNVQDLNDFTDLEAFTKAVNGATTTNATTNEVMSENPDPNATLDTTNINKREKIETDTALTNRKEVVDTIAKRLEIAKYNVFHDTKHRNHRAMKAIIRQYGKSESPSKFLDKIEYLRIGSNDFNENAFAIVAEDAKRNNVKANNIADILDSDLIDINAYKDKYSKFTVDKGVVDKAFDALPKLEDVFKPVSSNSVANNTYMFANTIDSNPNISDDVKGILTNSMFSGYVNRLTEALDKVAAIPARKEDIIDDVSYMIRDAGGNLPQSILDSMAYTGAMYIGDGIKQTLSNDSNMMKSMLSLDSKDPLPSSANSVIGDIGTPFGSLANQLGGAILENVGMAIDTSKVPNNFDTRMQQALGNYLIIAMSNTAGGGKGAAKVNYISRGYIQEIRESEMLAEDQNPSEYKDQRQIKFVSIAKDKFGDIPILLDKYITWMNSVQSKLDGVFNTIHDGKKVTSKPVDEIPTKMRGTPMDVPKKFANNLITNNAVAYSPNTKLTNILTTLDIDTLTEIAGSPTKVDIDNANLDLAGGMGAKRNDVIKGLNNAVDFMNGREENSKPFFYSSEVISNSRMMVVDKDISYQANKDHRFYFSADAWRHTADINATDAVSRHNIAQFKLAIAQGLGKDTDKQQNYVSLTGLDNVYMNGKFNTASKDGKFAEQAVEVLNSIESGTELTAKDTRKLVEAVKHFGEDTHSLAALQALADLDNAHNGDGMVSWSIPKEVDGVTNGTANSLLQYAPFNELYKNHLNSVGMFFNGDTETDYLTWRGLKKDGATVNKDVYEKLEGTLNESKEARYIKVDDSIDADNYREYDEETQLETIDSVRREYFPFASRANIDIAISKHNALLKSAIEVKREGLNILIGQIDRKFSKDPVLTFTYMAQPASIATKKAVAIMKDVQENMTGKLMDFINEPTDENWEIFDTYQDAYAMTTVGTNNVALYRTDTREEIADMGDIKAKEYARTLLSQEYAKEINDLEIGRTMTDDYSTAMATIKGNLTPIFEDALNKEFGAMNEIRQSIVNVSGAMNYMFKALESKRLADLNEKYGAETTKENLEEMYSEMIKNGEMFTVISPTSEDMVTNTDSILVYKKTKQMVSKEKGGAVTTKVGKDAELTTHGRIRNPELSLSQYSDATTNPRQFGSTISESVYSDDIGVKAIPFLIIAGGDAAVNNGIMKNNSIGNIHDAKLGSTNKVQSSTVEYNKLHNKISNSWSLISNVNDTLGNLVRNYRELPKEYTKKYDKLLRDLALKAITAEGAKIKDISAENAITYFNTTSANLVTDSNASRKRRMDSQISFHNYPNSDVNSIQGADNSVNTGDTIPAADNYDSTKPMQEGDQGSIPTEGEVNGNNKTQVTSATVVDIFNSMGNVGTSTDSDTHGEYLNDYMNNVIAGALDRTNAVTLNVGGDNKAGSSYGRFNEANKTVHITHGTGNGLVNGIAPNMSSKETFAHEMTHAIWKSVIDTNDVARGELTKMYRTTKRAIIRKYGRGNEWKSMLANKTNYTEIEEKTAKALYDYTFNNSTDKGYLHEFGSYGLTNEALISELKDIKNEKAKRYSGGDLFSELLNVLSDGIDMLMERFKGNKSKNVHDEMLTLVKDTTVAQNRAKGRLNSSMQKVGQSIEAMNRRGSEILIDTVWEGYKSTSEKYLAEDNKARKYLGKIGRIATLPLLTPYYMSSKGMSNWWNDVIMQNMQLSKDNELYKLLYELKNTPVIDYPFHKLRRVKNQMVDSYRQSVAISISNLATTSFSGEGVNLEDSDWESLNATVLKTNMSSLFTDISDKDRLNEVLGYLKSSAKRNSEIARLERELRTLIDNKASEEVVFNQAESLGHYMAQGTVGVDLQQLNSFNISRFANVVDNVDIDIAIQQLSTLQAIGFSRSIDRKATANIMATELDRKLNEGNLNGISNLLGQHRVFKESSLKRNFNGDKNLMIDGYTKENYDAQRSWEVASRADGMELENAGYSYVGDVPTAEGSPDRKLGMYVSKDGLLNKYATGLFSLSDIKSKGTQDNGFDVFTADKGAKPSYARRAKSKADALNIRNSERQKRGRVTNYNKQYTVPISNNSGAITSYRYMMSEENKIELMGKKDKANEVIGNMFGGIIEKEKSVEYNDKVVDLINQDFKDNYEEYRKDFVTIKAGDELYDLLPAKTRQKIKATTGNDAISVRVELKDLILGYRQFSLSNSLERAGVNHNITKAMRVSGNIWQLVVQKAKRNIVILMPAVITGNVLSNTAILGVKGVSPKDIDKDTRKALRNIVKYEEQVDKRITLFNRIKANPDNKDIDNLKQQLKEADLDIKRNPVSELIGEGAYLTITEDINLQSDMLLTTVGNTLESYGLTAPDISTKVPKVVGKVYKYATLAQDTNIGKMLAKATQYSDFTSRYVLYNHLTNNKGYSKDEAVREAIDTFIDYDQLSGKYMQYANDMGLLMFTKFLIRIQKVIANVVTTRPASVIAMELSQLATNNDFSDITDSNIIGALNMDRINTPDEVIEDAFVFNLLNWTPF